MRGIVTASVFSLAVIVVIAAIVAFASAHILRRLGVVSSSPVRYLPHFVFLLVVALTPMVSAGTFSLSRAIAVLGGMIAIWLAAVSASEYVIRKSSSRLRNTR